MSRFCGSTARMYHRQVSSRPRLVAATMSSRVAVAPACSKIRLPIPGVTGNPVIFAVYLVWISALRRPLSIQVVGANGRPLSKTELSPLDACATTNGSHDSPGSLGLLRNVTGSCVNASPTRVAPPGLENTVRPSWASRAPDDQYM